MKEYFRIMFGEWDVENEVDWKKWRSYSTKTLSTMMLLSLILWVMGMSLAFMLIF